MPRKTIYRAKNPRNKWLYFIRCGEAVKIGVSVDPGVRTSALQTGASDRIVLLALFPRLAHLEKYCHRKLWGSHLKGEWFSYSSEVEHLIQELLAGEGHDGWRVKREVDVDPQDFRRDIEKLMETFKTHD